MKLLNNVITIIKKSRICRFVISICNDKTIWNPPNLSELTPMIFNPGLTHLSSEASILSVHSLELYR